jgi:hypothetical protein
MTLAELYVHQNQTEMARRVLTEILRREPDHREAAIRLREIDGASASLRDGSGARGQEWVLSELARWLQNVGRIGGYAT